MQQKPSSDDIRSTTKLKARMVANQNATRDFDEWCIRQMPQLPLPARLLDLGAGTGKQVHLFSPLLSPNSEIFALDLEPESLATLQKAYSGSAKLRLVEGDFDHLDEYAALEPNTFDLVYSSYALYYTKDLMGAVESVFRLLRSGGSFWVIAPYSGTNNEFLEILRSLHGVDPFMDYVFDEFHRDVVAAGEAAGFSAVKPSLLRNQIRFPSARSFLDYLSNSLFYRPGFDQEIENAVHEICGHNGHFTVSKNVISLNLQK
jgi:ubiquinone/menaquinone biosynthesis C-methylase UbiE